MERESDRQGKKRGRSPGHSYGRDRGNRDRSRGQKRYQRDRPDVELDWRRNHDRERKGERGEGEERGRGDVAWQRKDNAAEERVYTDQFGRELTRDEYLKQQRESREQEILRRDALLKENAKDAAASNGVGGALNTNGTQQLSEDMDVMEAFGFAGFGSTKGQKIKENHVSAAKGTVGRIVKRHYRQYMNRPGGFNRPLDPTKDSKGQIKKKKKKPYVGRKGP